MHRSSNTPAANKATSPDGRLRVAAHLQAIEGNPLDKEQMAMFEMFERERWPDDRRLAHLRARAAAASGAQAAE